MRGLVAENVMLEDSDQIRQICCKLVDKQERDWEKNEEMFVLFKSS
jgi:hypothetical protein